MKNPFKILPIVLIIVGVIAGITLVQVSHNGKLSIGEFLSWFCVALLLICGGGLILIIQLGKHKSD